jgi:hypothetical protein
MPSDYNLNHDFLSQETIFFKNPSAAEIPRFFVFEIVRTGWAERKQVEYQSRT